MQFRLAHVFSPDFHKAHAVVLCYVTDATNFQTCLLASLIVSISGSNNSSVERTFSFVTNILSDKHLYMSRDCVWKQFHLERERKGGNYRSCVRDISQQTQNHHAFLWSRLGHEIDDEHDEDDLDSEDERLVDELMFFNVDNDTIDVSDTDK